MKVEERGTHFLTSKAKTGKNVSKQKGKRAKK